MMKSFFLNKREGVSDCQVGRLAGIVCGQAVPFQPHGDTVLSGETARRLRCSLARVEHYIRNCCIFTQILAGVERRPLPLAPSPSDGEGERG